MREYEYVSAIAREGTLSGAAVQLGISQPALTRFLQKEEGELGTARLKTASGDIELDGAAGSVWCSSVSGDVSVTTSVLPKTMELSSKSGDVEAGIPDAGPFSVRMKTVSGELSSAFQANFVNGVFVYGDGSGPAYSMTSVSGSVALDRR